MTCLLLDIYTVKCYNVILNIFACVEKKVYGIGEIARGYLICLVDDGLVVLARQMIYIIMP